MVHRCMQAGPNCDPSSATAATTSCTSATVPVASTVNSVSVTFALDNIASSQEATPDTFPLAPAVQNTSTSNPLQEVALLTKSTTMPNVDHSLALSGIFPLASTINNMSAAFYEVSSAADHLANFPDIKSAVFQEVASTDHHVDNTSAVLHEVASTADHLVTFPDCKSSVFQEAALIVDHSLAALPASTTDCSSVAVQVDSTVDRHSTSVPLPVAILFGSDNFSPCTPVTSRTDCIPVTENMASTIVDTLGTLMVPSDYTWAGLPVDLMVNNVATHVHLKLHTSTSFDCIPGTSASIASTPYSKLRRSVPKRKTGKRKIKRSTPSNSSIVIRQIPAGSEDSALSESDNDDEAIQVLKSHGDHHNALEELPEIEKGSKASKSSHYKWEDGLLDPSPDSLQFGGSTELPEDMQQLATPLQFFKYFMTDEIFEYVARQTALYSTQQTPDKPISVCGSDIEQFVGILFYMSLIQMSNSRNYWSPEFQVRQIVETMSLKRFEHIKRFLHFTENANTDGNDKLHKIRMLTELLKSRFLKVPMEENLSVNEQIIPFKGRSGLKEYMPIKPHKCGYKMFALSGVSGFAYNLEYFTGKGDNVMQDGEVDCGASGNVVIRMTRPVPSAINHKVYFDNYFNCPAVQIALAKRGILSLGTVRSNRVPNCSLTPDLELTKRGRGAFVENITIVDDVLISAVRWFDNKIVNLLSTFTGSQPASEVKRWSKKDKRYEQISCPRAVSVYNQHMGGVDLLDSLIGIYRCRVRSTKWYHLIFFHLMDMTMVNAWLLYRRLQVPASNASKQLRLHDFKASVAQALCLAGKDSTSAMKREHPTGDPAADRLNDAAAKRRRTSAVPCFDARVDGIGHWPQWSTHRERCKQSGCKGTSRVFCSKCKTHLCFNPKKDCFRIFHQ